MQVPESGIYIVSTPPKKVECGNELRMVVKRQKICVSKRPIVAFEEVRNWTPIQYDPKNGVHYIDISMTGSGMKTLTQTSLSLPDSRFALVLNGEIICLFGGSTSYAISTIRIGEDAPLKDLMLIEETLKASRD
jgi:hypothetical protein